MNPHHQAFVNEMILHNDAVRAYKAAYPNAQGEAARTAAYRLMKKEEIRQPITDAYKQLRLGIREDKAAFLHNELKIIDRKRKMLLELMFGTEDITPRQRMMAMKLDNELAAQQAHLLGYGSLKPQHNRQLEQPNESRHLEQPHHGRHSERREESPEHVEEAETTKLVTRPEVGQANRNNKKTPLLFLGGDVGRQRSSMPTGVVKCPAVLPTRVDHPRQPIVNDTPSTPPKNRRGAVAESVTRPGVGQANRNNLNQPEPYHGRHLEHSERSPEHIDAVETTKPVTKRNNLYKSPIASLRGTKQSQDNMITPCADVRLPRAYLPSQILPRQPEGFILAGNDEEGNEEPVTNSNITSPLERPGEVSFPILPMAYASPLHKEMMQV